MLLLLLAAAAADGDAALVKLLLLLQTLLRMMRLEVMWLLWVKGEVMPVAKHRHLHHGGPVEARPAVEAFGREGLDGGARSPLLAAHLRGAGAFVGGLRLSVHHRWLRCSVLADVVNGSGLVLSGRWCDDLGKWVDRWMVGWWRVRRGSLICHCRHRLARLPPVRCVMKVGLIVTDTLQFQSPVGRADTDSSGRGGVEV